MLPLLQPSIIHLAGQINEFGGLSACGPSATAFAAVTLHRPEDPSNEWSCERTPLASFGIVSYLEIRKKHRGERGGPAVPAACKKMAGKKTDLATYAIEQSSVTRLPFVFSSHASHFPWLAAVLEKVCSSLCQMNQTTRKNFTVL
jgi:hypothetical protein